MVNVVVAVVVIVDVVLVVVVAVVSDEGVDAVVILWTLGAAVVVSATDNPSWDLTDSDINIDSCEGDKVLVKPSTELPFCSVLVVSLTFCLLGIILFR